MSVFFLPPTPTLPPLGGREFERAWHVVLPPPEGGGVGVGGHSMTNNAALYRLLTWLSPGFPVGAYSYSHGLEYAVEAGLVGDRETLTGWIGTILAHGTGRTDAGVFCAAHAAAWDDDAARLRDVATYAAALRGTAELALESEAQGQAFMAAVERAWATPRLAAWRRRLGAEQPVVYAVAVAITAAAHEVRLPDALAAFLHAAAANLVSAGVRLVPLGQTDGQIAIAGLEPVVEAAVAAAQARPFDDVGAATPMVDWTSMRHEVQYTRLFRS